MSREASLFRGQLSGVLTLVVNIFTYRARLERSDLKPREEEGARGGGRYVWLEASSSVFLGLLLLLVSVAR